MTITLELVKLMNGQLFVTSKKGTGTQVMLEFPFEKGDLSSLSIKKHAATIPSSCFEGIEVLLVEDNPTNRIVAVSMLQPHGIQVTEAENGYDALDKLKTFSPDIILMDVQMPGIDGLETTRRIRKAYGTAIPILALTANVLLPMQVKCRDSGMNDFLGKPYEEEDLIAKIATMLNLYVVNKSLPNDDSELVSIKETKENLDTLPSSAPLFNLAKLEKLSRGDEAFMERMLEIFIREVPATVVKLQEAIQRNDLPEVKALAHRLKPSINDMGIVSLKEILQDTEDAADEGRTEIITKNFPLINFTVQEVLVELRKRKA
jgi:CheY-like chemotaxis protein